MYRNLLLSSAGLALFVNSSFAQEIDSAQDSDLNSERGEQDFNFEEIVVTAQRREETLQEVPVSVTVVDAPALQTSDVRSLEDLSAIAPGFLATTDVGYAAAPLSIRGVGGPSGGGNFFADEPVGVYLNDVYLARPSAVVADLVDVEAIQILRGPQGTLFGRNSTAGAVLVTSSRPTEEFEAYLEGTVARFDEYRIEGAISGPLTDRISGRLAVGYTERGDFADNLTTGEDVGGSENLTVRATTTWRVTDALSFDLIGEYLEREARPATIAQTDVGLQGGISTPFTLREDLDEILDDSEVTFNDPNVIDTDAYQATLLGNWDLGFAILDTVSAFRSEDLNGRQDSDSTALTLFNNNGGYETDQVSQEIRLSGEFNDIGFLQQIEWLVGGFYFREEIDTVFNINNFQGFFGLGTAATFDAAQELDAYAGFADVTLHLTDWFRLLGGLRYSSETKDFTNSIQVVTIQEGTVPPFVPGIGGMTLPPGSTVTPLTPFAEEDSFDDVSQRAILELDPLHFVDNRLLSSMLFYASYSTGFSSGGFNSFELDDAFDNENIRAFELGVKTTFWDGRGLLNLAGFINSYDDLQLRLPVPTGGVNIENVGEASIQGFEAEFDIFPFAGFRFQGNVAYLDAEIDEGVLPRVPGGLEPFPIGAPLPLIDEDVSGNSLARAPEFQTYLRASYVWQVPIGDLEFSTAYRYQDDVFFLEIAQDEDTFRADSWNEIDLRLELRSGDGRWAVAAFGTNVTNERYITQVTPLGGFPVAALNDPARWGFDVRLTY
jgi:iron complex outermembrane receptor protein